MQELEKILEEIEMKKKKCLDIVRVEIDPMEITIHREQYKGLRMAEDIIRKHMNDGWVPVEKALPEYGKKVLAYGKSGKIDIASLYSRDKHMWLVGSMCSVAFDIIAWRTLPEPYRLERRDNHDGE